MANNVDDLMPALMRSIRDELRNNGKKLDKLDSIDAKLGKMDAKLGKMDAKLGKMDAKLDKVVVNTDLTVKSLGTLIDVIDTQMADQMSDIRRRLSRIEDRLGLDVP